MVRNGDSQYDIQAYSLKTFKSIFNRSLDGDFLKMALIEQTPNGDVFCIAYQDSGIFFLSFINNKGDELNNFNVSDFLEIDQGS